MYYNMDRLADLYKALKRLAAEFLPAEHEDLAQEIAMKLWSKRRRLPANFGPKYLRAIVRNAACDKIRKDRRGKPLLYFSLNDNGSISVVGELKQYFYVAQTAVDRPEIEQQVTRALEAVQKLSAEQQSALELVARGYDYSEIALHQGVSVGTVRSRLHYARKKIEVARHENNY